MNNKNTGDGELDSIHANSIKGLDCPACGHPCLMLIDGYITCTLAECPNPDYAETAAQEVNKAVIKKLEDVMVKVDYTDSDTLITQKALRTHNNIQRELAQLTKEKEQA